MSEQLSTEQVLLLNNLMYMSDNKPLQQVIGLEGMTVEQLVSNITKNAETNQFESNKDYSSYMTVDDWQNIINRLQ